MMKFTYRGQEIIGELVEETETHYIIGYENDQISFHKDLTTMEKIINDEDMQDLTPYQNYSKQRKEKIIAFRIAYNNGLVNGTKKEYKKYTTKQILKMI